MCRHRFYAASVSLYVRHLSVRDFGIWGGSWNHSPGAQRDDCIFVAEMFAALKEREKICKTYIAYLTWDHF